jgi:hypothetical protein
VADEKVSDIGLHVGDNPCMECSIEGGNEAQPSGLAFFL